MNQICRELQGERHMRQNAIYAYGYFYFTIRDSKGNL